MTTRELGKVYRDQEIIVQQGDMGDCMYVVQAGQVEVVRQEGDGEIRLAVLGEGDVFGEMALFERETRSATVRSLGEARLLTVDKKTLMRRVHEDPSLAFHIVQGMSRRIREMNAELAHMKLRK